MGTRSLTLPTAENKASWLTVYPNPMEDYFSIRLIDAPTSSNAIYIINDVTGRLVLDGQISSNNQEIIVNTTALNAGSYMFSIFDGGHLIHTEKLIKQ